jgi:glucose-6-phosphate dehydrogenase assembly protein OpcA
MGPRVPSRTIVLLPEPGGQTRLDADISHECFPTEGHETCAEAVRVWLRGETAKHPATVVEPLQIPDLPAFLRWRGRPAWRSQELAELVRVHDRLVLDSSEWGDRLAPAYRELVRVFDRIVVSDLAWVRTLPWRAGLAELWPARPKALHVTGPRADAVLVHAWLQTRLRQRIGLRRSDAKEVKAVEVDGEPVRIRRRHQRTPAELLSGELEVFGRDPLYEAAVRSV